MNTPVLLGKVRIALWLGLALASTPLRAADTEFTLRLKNHRFEPAELRVGAHTRIKLLVQNQDATPEEFESHALNREKLIPAGSTATIYIGPLKPGRYEFFGEFHPASAQGAIVAE
jgi:plastocyanin